MWKGIICRREVRSLSYLEVFENRDVIGYEYRVKICSMWYIM